MSDIESGYQRLFSRLDYRLRWMRTQVSSVRAGLNEVDAAVQNRDMGPSIKNGQVSSKFQKGHQGAKILLDDTGLASESDGGLVRVIDALCQVRLEAGVPREQLVNATALLFNMA